VWVIVHAPGQWQGGIGDQSMVTVMIYHSIDGNEAMARGQWQWGVCGNVYVLFRGSMSCIVVDENVQNMWTAIIREVGPANRTGMIFWSVFGCGPNEIYSGH
jgi:hypothetical protein